MPTGVYGGRKVVVPAAEIFLSKALANNFINSFPNFPSAYQNISEIELANYEDFIEKLKEEDYDYLMNINVRSAFLVCNKVIPLMLKMTASLEQFISLDIPFLLEERMARVDSIKVAMDRGDVSTSEKFRKVAEAYQIENDFGRTIEAYRGSVNFEGKEFNADFLRVGRVALMFVTTNGDKAAYWDKSSGSWMKSSSALKRSTEEGLKIALKQSPPALIKIPVTAYE